jgi:hypothetical protein
MTAKCLAGSVALQPHAPARAPGTSRGQGLKNQKPFGFQNRQKPVGKPMEPTENHFWYNSILIKTDRFSKPSRDRFYNKP